MSALVCGLDVHKESTYATIEDFPRIRAIAPHGALGPSMWEVIALSKDEAVMECMLVDVLAAKARAQDQGFLKDLKQDRREQIEERARKMGRRPLPFTVQGAQVRVNWYNHGSLEARTKTEKDAEASAKVEKKIAAVRQAATQIHRPSDKSAIATELMNDSQGGEIWTEEAVSARVEKVFLAFRRSHTSNSIEMTRR